MTMWKSGVFLLAILALPLVGCASTKEIQVEPQPPSDVYSLADVVKLNEEDAKKEMFYGTLNGITFKERVTAEKNGCVSRVVAMAADKAVGTRYEIKTDHLSSDFVLTDHVASGCDGNMTAHYKVFQSPRGELEIGRSRGTQTDFTAPADRIKTVDLGITKAAVVLGQASPGIPANQPPEESRSWRLYIADDGMTVEIVSRGIPLSEGTKIAIGVLLGEK